MGKYELIETKFGTDGKMVCGEIYKRPDGSTFEVPAKHIHSDVGGIYSSYGCYTQEELDVLSKKFILGERQT